MRKRFSAGFTLVELLVVRMNHHPPVVNLFQFPYDLNDLLQ